MDGILHNDVVESTIHSIGTHGIAINSPVNWQYLNLHSEFGFSDEALEHSLHFNLEALFAFSWEPLTDPLV